MGHDSVAQAPCSDLTHVEHSLSLLLPPKHVKAQLQNKPLVHQKNLSNFMARAHRAGTILDYKSHVHPRYPRNSHRSQSNARALFPLCDGDVGTQPCSFLQSTFIAALSPVSHPKADIFSKKSLASFEASAPSSTGPKVQPVRQLKHPQTHEGTHQQLLLHKLNTHVPGNYCNYRFNRIISFPC